MTRQNLFTAGAIVGLALMLSAGNAAAQLAKDMVGVWTLVSADAFGSAPKGSLVFGPNGRFSAILVRSELPKYASNNRTQGTPDEYKATVNGSLAFFGTYAVNGTDINFHIEGSTFPNWAGSDQKRTNVSVAADELKYTQPAPSGGGPAAVVVWKRVK